jgi:hypothetical protein
LPFQREKCDHLFAGLGSLAGGFVELQQLQSLPGS